jgi:hypothetical protein
VCEYLVRAKGVDPTDRPLRRAMLEHTRLALMRMAERGQVRKILVKPEVWWELVG